MNNQRLSPEEIAKFVVYENSSDINKLLAAVADAIRDERIGIGELHKQFKGLALSRRRALNGMRRARAKARQAEIRTKACIRKTIMLHEELRSVKEKK